MLTTHVWRVAGAGSSTALAHLYRTDAVTVFSVCGWGSPLWPNNPSGAEALKLARRKCFICAQFERDCGGSPSP